MIISILGGPRSGKTTVAAKTFATLKEASFNCEFIPERARFYIASKRFTEKLSPNSPITLTDDDQIAIMKDQVFYQKMILSAYGNSCVVVTDSSPMNSLLYMTEKAKKLPIVQELIAASLADETVCFYAKPVSGGAYDPCRIHSFDQSLKIDSSIPQVIFPLINQEPVLLAGDIEIRHKMASAEIFRRVMFGGDK